MNLDELDWAIGELLEMWAIADANHTHAFCVSPTHYFDCMSVIEAMPRRERREVYALIERERRRIGRGKP